MGNPTGDTFLALLEQVDAQLSDDHYEGYRDGHETDAIAPNANRSPAYRHSWEIGRAEKDGRDPMPAVLARHHAATIRSDAIAEAMQLAGLRLPFPTTRPATLRGG